MSDSIRMRPVAPPRSEAIASRICSVEMYSSLRRSASSAAPCSTRLARRVMYPVVLPLLLVKLCIVFSELSSRRVIACASPPSRVIICAGRLLRCCKSARNICSTSSCVCCLENMICWARCNASCAFSVNLLIISLLLPFLWCDYLIPSQHPCQENSLLHTAYLLAEMRGMFLLLTAYH